MLESLLLLQATAVPPQELRAAPRVDLRIATRVLDCPEPAGDGEVVVCGSRGGHDPDRLEPLPPDGEDQQFRLRIGGATFAPQVETDRFGLATPTVRLTIPF
ncbi:hypothetical protein [Sphingomonas desiccabilis]|nr:hypothetical protein [Sphingomonas desiccabilis]MBB3911063.1 hypothetical protein [Sphingomonas desiccabilis]